MHQNYRDRWQTGNQLFVLSWMLKQPGLKIQISHRPKELPQLKSTENELMQSIDVLKSRNRIFDTPPTLDELLDPPEEAEIREMDLFTIGEKGEKEIVEMVEHEMAVARGEVIEINSDSDEDLVGPCITRIQMMTLCEQLERAVLEYGEGEDLALSRQLCCFRAHLRGQEFTSMKQMTLDKHFIPR
ncbi:hypothetical protein PAXRUDRAFT_604742 [Paxillus rubicundulus Ve08.2h10]|uniref:Uncharacterized protein n=1 Tax=Paxillus rubicundulus Ve08.2h10 TaxID=930991 RepID=A0A0D0BP21_9AGAM|nr:hypothetical protein PAXRUDRAFT_604742 [Paxillus rubicundulus Ve08.2h10]